MRMNKRLLAILVCVLSTSVEAGEKEELLKLRNTTTNLIRQLVKQGILTQKMADDMIRQAERDADSEAAAAQKEAPVAGNPVAGNPVAGNKAPAAEEIPADEVRVAYVPDIVKDEIRQQVRTELREEVVGEVMQKAKNEKWGLPEALPDWVRRFKLSGDLRLRSQHEFMGRDNISGPNAALFYPDVQIINDSGGVTNAGIDAGLNTTADRQRFRERLRLAVDATVVDGVKAGIRLATANFRDPVSTNQNLGNYGGRYQFNVDRAFLEYNAVNDERFNWLTLMGGRIRNPWYVGGGEFTGGSEIVWDTDLSFEGFAATWRHRFGRPDTVFAGQGSGPALFTTIGAFPLQESQYSAKDKWLLGGQLGLNWTFANQNKLTVGLGYYDYQNIVAKPNTSVSRTCDLNTRENTLSRPEFVQGGNSLAGICLEGTAANPGTQFGMLGLASDFNILNPIISFDLAAFAPYHFIFSADYAKNLGFNARDVAAARVLSGGATVGNQTDAWQVRMDVGWPKTDRWGHWNAFVFYKRVERDAVLDAFTDSDFHLGGTNVKGWVVGGNYGLAKNLWLTGRWLSADIITGPTFALDVLQLDINSRF